MKRITIFFMALLTSTGLVAHHATSVAFDMENLGTIEGEVVSVFWRNPHIVVTIERVSASGVRETWTAEAGSVNISFTNCGIATLRSEAFSSARMKALPIMAPRA